jgi:hypothetical protein
MTDLTDEQRKSIDILQSEQDADMTPEQRMGFMSRILSVSNADLATAPQPAPVKRGRTPKRKGSGVLRPQSSQ